MSGNYSIPFIQQKLEKMKVALLYIIQYNNEFYHNDIVRLVSMEENGRVWFLLPRPKYWCEDTTLRSIPIRLVFYQKELPYYINATGIANVFGISEEKAEDGETDMLLLSMMPTMIEYTEPNRVNKVASWMKNFNSFTWKLINGMQWAERKDQVAA